ncbi:hypothetical protein G9A89_014927 [Geosiphon pyriformis]|nr:hypothetical protein G9A89_014927 [Geosiphon pyriformis]
MAVDERYPGHEAVIAYLRDVDSGDCTYPHFLDKLRDTVLESPPFTEDWSGLDGIWYKRYAHQAHLAQKKVLLEFPVPEWREKGLVAVIMWRIFFIANIERLAGFIVIISHGMVPSPLPSPPRIKR